MLAHLMMHLPTVTIAAQTKSHRLVVGCCVKSRSASVSGEGQLRPSNGPQGAGAPLPLQLLSAACVHVQLVCFPGIGPRQSVFVASYSCVTHNTASGRSNHNPALSLSDYSSPSLSSPPPCVSVNGLTISVQYAGIIETNKPMRKCNRRAQVK